MEPTGGLLGGQWPKLEYHTGARGAELHLVQPTDSSHSQHFQDFDFMLRC